jgi:hypothetical protein
MKQLVARELHVTEVRAGIGHIVPFSPSHFTLLAQVPTATFRGKRATTNCELWIDEAQRY